MVTVCCVVLVLSLAKVDREGGKYTIFYFEINFLMFGNHHSTVIKSGETF